MTTILAVDDSASLRSAIEYSLVEKGGYELALAEDGKHAIGLVELRRNRVGKPFDLVLADINMPVMDGFEMVERIRNMADYRYTPILFLTTETSADAKQRGRELNATGWINKPFSPEKLLAVVAQVLK